MNRFLARLPVTILSVLLVACPPRDPYQEGLAAFEREEYAKAVHDLTRARRPDLDDTVLLYVRGLAHAALAPEEAPEVTVSHWDLAIEDWQELRRRSSDRLRLLVPYLPEGITNPLEDLESRLADARVAKGDPEGALPHYEELIRRHPDDGDLLSRRGAALLGAFQQKLASVTEELEELFLPNRSEAIHNQFKAAAWNPSPDEVNRFEASLEANLAEEYRAELRDRLVDARQTLHQAIDTLRKALVLQPSESIVRRLIGIYLLQGRHLEAQVEVEDALHRLRGRMDQARLQLDLARVYEALGETEPELRALEAAESLAPRDDLRIQARKKRILVLLRAKQMDQALGLEDGFREATEGQPRFNGLLRHLDGLRLYQTGERSRSLDLLHEAALRLPLAADDEDETDALQRIAAGDFFLLAAANQEQGLPAKTENFLSRAVAYDRENAAALRMRGELRLRAGRWSEAARDFERAIEVDPTDADSFAKWRLAETKRLGFTPDRLSQIRTSYEYRQTIKIPQPSVLKLRNQRKGRREPLVETGRLEFFEPLYLYELALAARAQGDWFHVDLFASELAGIQPAFLPARRLSAEALQRQGNLEDAQAIYDEILELAPKDVPTLRQALACARERGDRRKEGEILLRLLHLDPDTTGYPYSARQALERGEIALAERLARQGLERGSPTAVPALHEILGEVAYRREDGDRATEEFLLASKDALPSTLNLERLIRLFTAAGRGDRVSVLLAKILASDWASRGPPFPTRLGGALLAEGYLEDATRLLHAGRKAFPSDARLARRSTAALLRAGRFAEAERELRQRASEKEEDWEARFDLIRLDLAWDHPEEAKRQLEEAGKIPGLSPDELALLALAHARLGQQGRAEATVGRIRRELAPTLRTELAKGLVAALFKGHDPAAAALPPLLEGFGPLLTAVASQSVPRSAVEQMLDFLLDACEPDFEMQAIEAYGSIEGRIPASPLLGTFLVDPLRRSPDKGRAIGLLSQLVSRGPRAPEPYEALGTLLLEDGGRSRARQVIHQGLEALPQAADLHAIEGRLLLQAGDDESAVPHLRAALKKRPTDTDLLRDYANALERSGKIPEAISLMERAYQRSKQDFAIGAKLLDLYEASAQGRGEALALAAGLQQRSPRHVPSLAVRVRAARGPAREGFLPALEACLREGPDAQDLDGQVRGYLLLGELFEELGRREDAISAYTAAVGLSPASPEATLAYAWANVRQGNLEEAEESFRRVLLYDPENRDAALGLARVLLEIGKHLHEASALLTTVFGELPEDPRARDLLGWLLFRFREYPRAAKLIAWAHERLPEDADVLYHHALAQYFLDSDGAREAIEAALLSPEIQDARRDLLESLRARLAVRAGRP